MIKNLRYLCTLLLIAVASAAWGDEVTDVIDNDATSSSLSSVATNVWVDFTLEGISGANYQIHSMGLNGASHAIQWNKNGYLYASKSGGIAKSITIKGNSKSVDIYASNTAYTAKATATKITSLTASETGATYEFSNDYAFIAINGTTSSTQIQSIEIVWEEDNQDLQESDLTLTSPSTISIAPEGTSQITYTTTSTGAITWTSMNPSIATVVNGVVTGVETGTTIVTLEQAADADYKVGTASVVVKVVEDGEGVWNAGFATKIENGLKLDFNTDNIVATYLKGEATTDPYSDNDEIRVYKGSKLTFAAPIGNEITSIVFTCTNNEYATALSNGSANVGTLTADAASVTWTGVAQSVEIDNSDAQARISKIVVTYGPASEKQPSDFAITSSTTVNLELPDNNTATVTYSTSSTGTISWSSNNEDVAKVANGVITAFAAGTTTISVSQAADANYEASEVFIITVNVTGEAARLANISELTAMTEAGEYKVALENAVVTYVNGNYAYIQDASGAVVMYKKEHGLNAGDILNGTATVNYTVRNANPQITSLEDADITPGDAPNPTELAASAWNSTISKELSKYYKITGTTITSNNNKYYIQLGNENVQLYGQGEANPVSVSDLNAKYTVVGFPTMYNTTPELQIFVQPKAETSIREELTMTFTGGTCEFTDADSFVAPTLTITDSNGAAVNGLDITFVSDNTDVATVTGEGIVSIVGYGTAVITASFDGNDDYLPATATYSIIYTNSNQGEYTWDLSTNSYDEEPTADFISWSSNYATMTNTKGTSTTNVNNYIPTDRTSTRMYSGNVLTITPATGYVILSVTFTATTEGYASALKNSTWTNATTSENGKTVTVTPNVGSIAMSAVISGTCGFTGVKVNYELNTNPSIAIPSLVNVGAAETEGTLEVSYQNMDDYSSAELIICNENGEATTYDWFEAELNSDKNTINYLIAANSISNVRTAYLKVKVGDIYSNLVTITQAAFVIDYVTLPFEYDGNGAMITEIIGLTGDGLGNYNNGSPAIKFDETGDWLVMKTNEAPKYLSFDVKGMGSDQWTGTFTVQVSADGENYTDLATYTELTGEVESMSYTSIDSDVRYIKWVFTSKTLGYNVALGKIYAGYGPKYKLGDVNGDNTVNVADVTKLVNLLLNESESHNPADHPAADLDGDEDLDAEDVRALVEMILSNSNQ